MPHLVILYTPGLDAALDLDALCRDCADVMVAQRDDSGAAVFPTGGTRVLAYGATHSAVADGQRPYDFLYLNLRMARGRSPAIHRQVGDALVGAVRARLDPLMDERYIGITLQVDEGTEVYDAKHSSIHPLFGGPPRSR